MTNWLDWQPKTATDCQACQPAASKSTDRLNAIVSVDWAVEKSSVSDVSEFLENGTDSIRQENPAIQAARDLLNRKGCRQMKIDGELVIGIWSDLDSPSLRRALQVLGKGDSVLYLDGAGVPDRYRLRSAPGEPRYRASEKRTVEAEPVTPAAPKPVFGKRRPR